MNALFLSIAFCSRPVHTSDNTLVFMNWMYAMKKKLRNEVLTMNLGL